MALFYFAIVVSAAVSAAGSWMVAARTSDNVPRTVSTGGISAFLAMIAVFGVEMLIREPPGFPKLSPTEELAAVAIFFGGPVTIGGIVIGCLCLIFRNFNAGTRR